MEQGYTYTPKMLSDASEVSSPTALPTPVITQSSTEKYIVWHIQGGLGKNIAATSLISSLKETYPDRKLIMIVSYPEAFLNNSFIDRVYQLGQSPYFFQDYIENKDTIIFRHEPYHQTGHINMTKHLIENWCDLLGLEYKNQQPKIFLNFVQQQLLGTWTREKPVMAIQTCGGPGEADSLSYSWARDMPQPIAQTIVDKYKDQYHIIQITRQSGYELTGVERFDKKISNIELFAILGVAKKLVLIDSCLQHAAAAFNIKATVLWVGTSPTVFGYSLHNNIKAQIPKIANQLIGSYLFDYQFENNVHECPYIDLKDFFTPDQINNI
tara:strand:+ start:193 stop:1167 length:975 start_codon:yes stop_codon:yes gene_type:complete